MMPGGGAIASTPIADVPRVPVIATSSVDGPHGPGFHLFGEAHPTWTRKRQAETLEDEIRAALRKADDASTRDERKEAVRELKAAVRETVRQAPVIDDAYLSGLATALGATQSLQQSAAQYLEDVRRAMELRERQEQDDLEALTVIMRAI